MTKTQRLLHSFASVELLPQHRNYGDQTPALRDFGVAPSVATALIRWGETHDLVCTFEDSNGRGRNAYSWQPAFLRAAVGRHLEIFGEEGWDDIPQALYDFVKVKPDRSSGRRGRPVTGEARTPTERVKAMDEALIASGGRILNRLRLAPEATAALAALSARHGSDRAAIEAALIDKARKTENK